jgi:ribose transport system substrate-binding protein
LSRFRIVSVALIVLIAAVALSACGSSGSSSSSTGGAETEAESENTGSETTASEESEGGASSTVVAEVEKLKERPTKIPITTPFQGKMPSGKQIDYLQCAAPICVEIGEQLSEGAEAVGWKVKVVPEGATPEEVRNAWELVAEEEPDGIVPTGGYEHQIFRQQLAEVKADGIPVIGHSEATPANQSEGIYATLAGPELNERVGKQEANWILAEDGESANVLFINSGYPINTIQEKSLKKQLAAECSGCEFSSYLAPITSIGKDLAGKIATEMQANPSVNYLVPAFGDMAVGVPAALAGAGVEPVPTITQSPDEANTEDIKSGKITAAWAPVGAVGAWSIIDTFGRIFTKQEYPSEIPPVEWWMTGETLPESEPYSSIEGFQEQFEELWHVK